MIDPGRYRARCTGPNDAQWGMSANGNLQVALLFELLDESNQRMTWVGTFAAGKATEFALQALENCGWTGNDPTQDLTGVDSEEVELAVAHEEDQEGVTRARISWVNKPGSGRIKFKQPLQLGELAAFSADLRGAVAARRQGGGVQQSARRQAPEGSNPNDYDPNEIPF